MPRIAYYETNLQDFLAADEDAILGALSMQHGFALEHQQKHAGRARFDFCSVFCLRLLAAGSTSNFRSLGWEKGLMLFSLLEA